MDRMTFTGPAPGGGGRQELSMADAFASLFAEEQGEPAPPREFDTPTADLPLALDEQTLDEIARRAIARLSETTIRTEVRQLVSEIAEQLIRQEIERLKSLAR